MFRRRCQAVGRGFELGRGLRHDLDDLGDHRFEVARDQIDALRALDLRIGLGRRRLVGALLGDQDVLEDLQRPGHRSDFIGAIDVGHHHVMPARGEVADHLRERRQRLNDAAAHDQHDAGEQPEQRHDDGGRDRERHQGPVTRSLGAFGCLGQGCVTYKQKSLDRGHDEIGPFLVVDGVFGIAARSQHLLVDLRGRRSEIAFDGLLHRLGESFRLPDLVECGLDPFTVDLDAALATVGDRGLR